MGCIPAGRKLLPYLIGLLLAAASAWYSVALAIDWGLSSPLYWLWAWFAWLGWLVVLGELLHVPLTLGASWYRDRPFEGAGALYVRLGVRFYKKFLFNGDYLNWLARRFRPGRRILHDGESMRRWLAVTRSKEAAHALHAALTVPALAFVLWHGWLPCLFCLLALTALFDVYPVMLQRYNRFRIERTLEMDPNATRILFAPTVGEVVHGEPEGYPGHAHPG